MKEKKKGGCIKIFLIIFCILVAIGVIINLSGRDEKSDNDDNTTTESASDTNNTDENVAEGNTTENDTTQRDTTPQLESFEIELGAGIYTAGRDIPVGNYNLTAISGTGNVSSSNMFSGGLNEIMANPADEYSIDAFSNAKLNEGVTLNISSTLILHLQCDEADIAGMVPRIDPGVAPIDLGSGNFIAGTDFPAGTYTIIATGSNGNVSSSNLYNGGINEIMGTENNGLSISEFKNVELPEGTTLTISGTSIQLIQVGE